MQPASRIGTRRFPVAACIPAVLLAALGLSLAACGELKKAESKPADESNPPAGFFTVPPFLAALLTFGADRILFSVDFPFSDSTEGTRFLSGLPVSPADRGKIAHGNADALLKLAPTAR